MSNRRQPVTNDQFEKENAMNVEQTFIYHRIKTRTSFGSCGHLDITRTTIFSTLMILYEKEKIPYGFIYLWCNTNLYMTYTEYQCGNTWARRNLIGKVECWGSAACPEAIDQ